jgi:hypothetical protein
LSEYRRRASHLPGTDLSGSTATAAVGGAGPQGIAARRAGALVAVAVAVLAGLTACGPSGSDTQSGAATQAADRICLSGTLAYRHHDAEAGEDKVKQLTSSVARGVNWELWGKTSASGEAQRLASGVTDETNGTFKACSDHRGPLPELYVKFRSSSTELWRLISPVQKTEFSFDSRHLTDVSASGDLGTVEAPADQQGAWKVVDTLNDLYRKAVAANTSGSRCWTSHQASGTCDELTFTWASDAVDGGYWDPDSRNVVLAAEDVNSRHLILHEAGHWLNFELYDH